MKKTLILLLALLVAAPSMAQSKKKRGLGGLLDKATKAAGQVADAIDVLAVDEGESCLMRATTLKVVKAEGDPATGEVVVSIKAEPKKDATLSLGISSSIASKRSSAADSLGNTYAAAPLDKGSYGKKTLTRDLPCTFQFLVSGVDPSVTKLRYLQLTYMVTCDDKQFNTGMSNVNPLKFVNLPIEWKALPTENIVAWTMKAQKSVALKIASCKGDKASGKVVIDLVAEPNFEKVQLGLTDWGKFEAFDKDGNALSGKWSGVDDGMEYFINLERGLPSHFKLEVSGVAAGAESVFMCRVPFYVDNFTNDTNVNSQTASEKDLLLKNVKIDWQ